MHLPPMRPPMEVYGGAAPDLRQVPADQVVGEAARETWSQGGVNVDLVEKSKGG